MVFIALPKREETLHEAGQKAASKRWGEKKKENGYTLAWNLNTSCHVAACPNHISRKQTTRTVWSVSDEDERVETDSCVFDKEKKSVLALNQAWAGMRKVWEQYDNNNNNKNIMISQYHDYSCKMRYFEMSG